MNNYQAFVDQLDEHLSTRDIVVPETWLAKSALFVDGLAAGELRKLVDINTRRACGAFFTNSQLAYDVLSTSGFSFEEDSIIYDPAVGAGNLLLAVWKLIDKKIQTFKLTGTDIHSQFIQAAKLRLQIYRTINHRELIQDDLSVSDGLVNNDFYQAATHIVTNPPFNLIEADDTIQWCKGKVSAAAIFIEKIVTYVNPNVQIVAILPDVLRSGSRYKKWRKLIESYCIISNLRKLGQFDQYADVDVFSITLKKRVEYDSDCNSFAWVESNQSNKNSLKDSFDISVGHVVDNRDTHIGPMRPFLVSRGLSGWQTVTHIPRMRQFSGKSVDAPFVVIKRTSRVGDKRRAVASIIDTREAVYIDNHLLIAKPKSGKIEDCQRLIEYLATNEIDAWLDEQIRCRHLTVKVVERIPYDA